MKLYDPVFILRTALLVVLCLAALVGTSLALLDWGLHQVDQQIDQLQIEYNFIKSVL